MRLTLRTLLAYLDDILEPSQAREIGEKLHESTFATSLVEKIQDVVRRRRIGAPALSGPGSDPDPNQVAEYLDNTLPPEAVADLERICLESDMHLAEVAACHQVLTLVLGEAIDVPTHLREQMYALGAIAEPPEKINGDGVRHTPKVVGVGAADAARKPLVSAGNLDRAEQYSDVVPRRSQWKRVLPVALGALILAGWAYIIFTDPAIKSGLVATHEPSRPTEDSAHAPPAGGEIPAPLPDQQLPDQQPESPIPEEVASTDTASTDTPLEVELQEDVELAQASPASGDLAPSEKETTATTPTSPLESPATEIPPQDDAFALKEQPPTAEPTADITPDPAGFTPPSAPAAEVAPEAAALNPFQVQYANTDGVLLRHDEAGDAWTLMPRRALIFPGEEIAAPDPFDARLAISNGQPVFDVLLKGGTRVRSLEPTNVTGFGLEIDQGRVLISSHASAQAAIPVLRLKIRNDEWTCELSEPHTVLALEVISVRPTRVGDLSGETKYDGGMQLVSGGVRLTDANGRETVLHPERSVVIFGAAADGLALQPTVAQSVPDWALPNATIPPLARLYAARYEKEFLTDQPLSASIRPVVKDRQPRLSELATRTLALTGSLQGLVDALSATHQESRIAAIEGLQQWLSRDPGHEAQLQAELQNRFSESDAAAILRMLWGYGPQDGHDRFKSRELVISMLHDEVAIRELAAYHVQKLTNRTLGYRADRRADEREAIVKRWQKDLERTGALLGGEPGSGDNSGVDGATDTTPAPPLEPPAAP